MAIPKIQAYSFQQISMPVVNRVDWKINTDRAVLLIHDMQNYFVDYFQLDAEPISSVLNNIQILKAQCKSAGIPVIYTAQPGNQSSDDRALLTDFWGPGLGDDVYQQSIVHSLAPEVGDILYTKWRYSALQRTPVTEFMQEHGRDQLIICGIYAHIGILATSLEAFMSDIKPFVVADAVADFSADDHNMALQYIAQRCGKVIQSDELASQLSENTVTEKSQQMHSSTCLSLENVKQQISDCLMVPLSDIGDEDNLIHLGLDSIRLMGLIETWRNSGANVSFADLAEATSLTEWWAIIQESMQSEDLNAATETAMRTPQHV
ncbi:MAG: isochorismatase family protein [Gammaproteobacteria bacterium]